MQYPASGASDYLSFFLAFINSTVRSLSAFRVKWYAQSAQSWTPLVNQSSLFSQIAKGAPDGSADFDDDTQLVTTVNEPSVVQIIIDNLDDGDHPFHLHGHKVSELNASGINFNLS